MGIEPMVRVLQTLALPLGDVARNHVLQRNDTRSGLICQRWARLRRAEYRTNSDIQHGGRGLELTRGVRAPCRLTGSLQPD